MLATPAMVDDTEAVQEAVRVTKHGVTHLGHPCQRATLPHSSQMKILACSTSPAFCQSRRTKYRRHCMRSPLTHASAPHSPRSGRPLRNLRRWQCCSTCEHRHARLQPPCGRRPPSEPSWRRHAPRSVEAPASTAARPRSPLLPPALRCSQQATHRRHRAMNDESSSCGPKVRSKARNAKRVQKLREACLRKKWLRRSNAHSTVRHPMHTMALSNATRESVEEQTNPLHTNKTHTDTNTHNVGTRVFCDLDLKQMLRA